MTKRKWTDHDLQVAYKGALSVAEICRRLGLSASPGNRRTLKKYATKLDLDLAALPGQAHGKGRSGKGPNVQPFDEILVKDSPYGSGSTQLKERLYNAGLLLKKCVGCGLDEQWEGKPLVLQIDHINGDPRDHRLVNLRILCPNCHSQTPTFKRGTRGRYSPPSCLDCGKQISRCRSRCQSCAAKHGRRNKIDWPTADQLQELVDEHGYRGAGRLLGVSDTAVRKHLRSA